MDITKEEAKDCEQRIMSAMLNADVEELDNLIHPDLLFNAAMGLVATKEMDLATYRSGLMKINCINAGNEQISIVGDTATVSVQVEMDAKFSGQEIKGKFLFLRVWKKIEGKIQVIAGSSISL